MFPAAQPPLSPANPYRRLRAQSAGSASFGPSHLQAILAQGITSAPRAAYWQKWYVHRTLRPESYGGLAHHRLANGVSDYPLHDDFLRSEALDRTRAKQGSYLLSQTFPEGSPVFLRLSGWRRERRGRVGHGAEGLLRREPHHRQPGSARSGRPDPAGAVHGAIADRRWRAEQARHELRNGPEL